MTRSDLVRRVAQQNPAATLTQIEKCVNIIFDEITNTLAKGGRVELRGFGVFEVRHRDARTGRNPRTGQSVKVPAKAVPFFKAGKQLRQQINS